MTIERGEGATSPVHVHVDEKTPVHVHVKKPKKAPTAKAVDARLADTKTEMKSSKAAGFGSGNLRRSTATATARSRSKSPTRGPWVPPPGKATHGQKYSWGEEEPTRDIQPKKSKSGQHELHDMGSGHRLEINGPEDVEAIQSTLRVSDLDTDEEDRVHGHMRQYEKKIDSLMSEVGTLKNEVELQKTSQQLQAKAEQLETSRVALEDQEAELEDYRRELEATEIENRILRRSMNSFKEEAEVTKDDYDRLGMERELLMKKLVEVEMDGQAAAKQVAALRDATRRLREEKRMSSADATMLTKQKDLLMERLSDFESTNRTLRRMLRDRHEQEAATLRLSEQRDLLLRKLSETEDMVSRARTQLLEKERVCNDLKTQVEAQRDENLAVTSLQGSLESTRGHLQKQLRQKEADCNRMAVQIRSLESNLAQEKIEVDHLQELLAAAREKAERDKEALKKATRVQKQRATRSEDAVEQLNAQLMERESLIAEHRSEVDGLRLHNDKVNKEKAQLLAEVSAMKIRVAELENLMETLQDNSKAQLESTTAKLHDKISEVGSLRLDNERLKTSMATIEDKLAQGETEMAQLRGNLRQYETLVDEYRTQMNKSRREADDTMVQLEEQKLETGRVQKDGQAEIEKVKTRLQTRLMELEPIPELLKTTELKLHDNTEKLLSAEKRNTDNTKLIAELTAKVEHQNDTLDSMREKWHSTNDENRSNLTKAELLERKLHDVEEQNRELLSTVAKREEGLHTANMRLDQKTQESSSLSRQLEAALTDARRQSEVVREKSHSKERSNQSRILDLESNLSQSRAEVARIKREKEEAERKFNSRLYDLKDRLEQSHSTNRSMQNYVQFLKNSYANVFGDGNAATSSPMRGTFH